MKHINILPVTHIIRSLSVTRNLPKKSGPCKFLALRFFAEESQISEIHIHEFQKTIKIQTIMMLDIKFIFNSDF
jgi:hypothetical protein